jgi:SAM-dependent methyltransferase
MITRLIPRAVKSWSKSRIREIASEGMIKYIPYEAGNEWYMVPKHPQSGYEICDSGLAIPPSDLWLGYADSKDEYLASGNTHVTTMLELINASGFSFAGGNRVLDFGCGAGRMIRHLKFLSQTCEIWGTDISAPHICWAKQHLSPPFHFAVTTTIPHLPFEDRYFSFIYCGSVFTHIDDLAEAWLCELRRILSPQGRLYLTIHDHHTMELFDGAYDFTPIAKRMKSLPEFSASRDIFGMLVIGRDTVSQVFYDDDYLSRILNSLAFRVLSITPEAYHYQTAVLVERQ